MRGERSRSKGWSWRVALRFGANAKLAFKFGANVKLASKSRVNAKLKMDPMQNLH